MKTKLKQSKLLAMYLLIVLLLLTSAGVIGQPFKDYLEKQEYEKRTFEGCQADCGDVEPFDYEAVLASERLWHQLENKAEVHERREKARLVKLEEERLRRIEEKKKEQMKKQVVSRGSGYQSTFEITHYTAFCPTGCTGKTASGYDVSNTIYYQGYRIVAAPKTLAFYTKLRIHYEDGTVIDAIVLDRGGDIGLGRLDLLVKSREEAYRLGRQQVKVEIIK